MQHQRLVQELVLCPFCASTLAGNMGYGMTCNCGRYVTVHDYGIDMEEQLAVLHSTEMNARDKEASGYLDHAKFPTQISRFNAWLSRARCKIDMNGAIALDLGAGPGPFTGLLQRSGMHVLAVDFSISSLRVNAMNCSRSTDQGTSQFFQADLNTLCLRPCSVDVLVMADFLQHLGSRKLRERLLQQAFSAIKPGGVFFLSCFNINMKNYLKGDVHGDFSDGNIPYERLTPPNVVSAIPAWIKVESVLPMNIFHSALADSLACHLPGARYLARMMLITGSRKASDQMQLQEGRKT